MTCSVECDAAIREPAGAVAVRFPDGLPAFESHRDFELVADADIPLFYWLRSASEGEPVTLVTVDPFVVAPGYVADIREPDALSLEIGDPSDALLLAIVNFSGYPESVFVNLSGPILMNARTWRARQVVLENASDYGFRHSVSMNAEGAA